MSGIEVLLSVLISASIFISAILVFFVFINSGLTARSLCFVVVALCASFYSIMGLMWVIWDGTNVEFIATLVRGSETALQVLGYALFMGALSFTMIGKENYRKVGIIAAIAIIVQLIAIWMWNTSLTMSGMSISKSETGETVSVLNPIGNTWLYITVFVFLGAAFASFIKAIKRQPDPISKRLIKRATIGTAVSVILVVGINELVGILPHAHSIGHLGLFVLVFALYRAFNHDYGILDEG